MEQKVKMHLLYIKKVHCNRPGNKMAFTKYGR